MAAPPEVIAVIPARYTSVRLPGKAMADIGGRPMIRHVVEGVAGTPVVSRIIVATDHESIAAAAMEAGADAVMTPADLPSGTDRIAFVADTLPGNPVLVNVQGDEPFVTRVMIEAGVRTLLDGPGDCAATIATRIVDPADIQNPDVVKVVIALDGDALYFSRSAIPYDRDRKGTVWYRHIGLYVYTKAFLKEFTSWKPTPLERAERLEQLRILEQGRRIRVAVGDYDCLSVDTPADLERARALYRRNLTAERA